MELKKLLAVAVAAAFALPLAAQASASGDRMILAQSGASSVGTGPTGGTPSPQSAGEPKAPTDTKADMRRCEALTGMERDNCMRERASSGATSGATGSAAGTTGSSAGATGSTGTTAGPGEASPKVGAGSDTATSSSSSGTGKAGGGSQ